ncbi:MAG: energy transducer TonB [Gemmatimonadota bacterium]|nr:energy transducer TonB [Gemmatimonadota bacterium]MDE2983926.1 energy transducer TonB [Gemmatimonadota bacterium]
MKRTAIIALGIVNLVLLPLAIGGACIRTAPSLPVAGPEAESLFTGLTGAWVIDREATNSSRTSLESAVVNSDGLMGVPANETSQIMREIPEIEDQETLHFVSDAVLKLTQYPLTLALHVDPTQVVSKPTPGNGLTLLMDLASQGVSGRALVRFQLDIKGQVQNVEVAESSGNTMLDQLALRVARTYRFTPIVYQGEAVSGQLILRLNFSVGRQ